MRLANAARPCACPRRLHRLFLQAAAAAATFRRAVHSKLIAQEERLLTAESVAATAQQRLEATNRDLQSAREQVKALLETNEQLKAALHAEEDWCKRDSRRNLIQQPIGPVTIQVSSLVRCVQGQTCAYSLLWCHQVVPLLNAPS
jgi:hypothetical protein